MRIVVFLAAFVWMLLSSIGCTANQSRPDWRTVEEGFIMDVPVWLDKREMYPIDSHAGEYTSRRMQVNFDEVYGLGYTPQEATARHRQLARAFRVNSQDASERSLIRRLGSRFAEINIGTDKKWVEQGYPGSNAVEFFCPDPRGGYLSVWITFRDPADTPIALQIAKSIHFH